MFDELEEKSKFKQLDIENNEKFFFQHDRYIHHHRAIFPHFKFYDELYDTPKKKK